LSEAVDAPLALFEAVGVPRKVVVEHGVEEVLEVDPFREAVCRHQDAPLSSGGFGGHGVYPRAAHFVGVLAGDALDDGIPSKGFGQSFGEVFRRQDVAAEDDGRETFVEPFANLKDARSAFDVAGALLHQAKPFGELREARPLLDAQFGAVQDGGGQFVVARFEAFVVGVFRRNTVGASVVLLREGTSGRAVLQHARARPRAGHDAAQKGQRRPVAESLLVFAAAFCGHEVGGEEKDVVVQLLVVRIQFVGEVDGDPLREWSVLVHPAGDVLPLSLDEVAGKLLPEALFPVALPLSALELRLEEAEQRAKLIFLSRMGGGGDEDEMALPLFGESAKEPVAELLSGGGALRARAGVRFVDDDQFGSL